MCSVYRVRIQKVISWVQVIVYIVVVVESYGNLF